MDFTNKLIYIYDTQKMEYDNFQTVRREKEEKKKSDRYFGAKSFTHL